MKIAKLKLPPRRVPFSLWCRALSNPAGILWALGFSVSLIYILFFSGDGEPGTAMRLRLQGVRAPARIESIAPSNLRIGGLNLVQVTYSYYDGREVRRRTTFDYEGHWEPGKLVETVYLPDRPEVSRLRGERKSHAGVFGGSLFLFPLSAVIFGIPAWRRAFYEALLLREGFAAEASIERSKKLAPGLRRYDLYRYDYEFETLWGEVFAGSSIGPLDTSPRRMVLYLARDASVSTLLDALPQRFGLKVDPKGEWVATFRPVSTLLAVATAALAVVATLVLLAAIVGLLPDLGR